MNKSEALDLAFAALADPTRRAILAHLAKGEATVNELGEPFAMSQPAISKHLKVLERAGLISGSRDAQRRPRRLEPMRLKDVADWVGTYREYWEESYARLDDYLAQLKNDSSAPTEKAPTANKENAHGPKARNRRPAR